MDDEELHKPYTGRERKDLVFLLALAADEIEPRSEVKSQLMAQILREKSSEQITNITSDKFDKVVTGVSMRPLYETDGYTAFVFKIDPHSQLRSHEHTGFEHTLVVDGSCRSGDVYLCKGDYVHAKKGTKHPTIRTDEEACTLFVVTHDLEA